MAHDLDYRALEEPVSVPEEPYRAAIMAHYRLEPFAVAAESAAEMYELYIRYRDAGDFAGMEMVRRTLQRAFAEAKDLLPHGPPSLPLKPNSADVFSKTYRMVRNDPAFAEMRQAYLAAQADDREQRS
jgi:hypothetical protein